MEFKKILLTGADGLLGSNLVRELLHRNFEVSVFLQPGTKSKTLEGLDIHRLHGDILDFESILSAAKGHDVVIHAAANTAMWPSTSQIIRDVNLQGTENVVKAVIRLGVKRLIHVGTANSFERGSQDQPGSEASAKNSESYGLDYIESKRLAQELVLTAVKEDGLPALVVNPTFMIGPYDSKPSSGELILSLYHRRVPVIPGGSKNYIAVKDAAVAIANSIVMGQIGECYILGNHNCTYEEAFNIVSQQIGVSAPKLKLPALLIKLYGSMNSKLASIFDFAPKVTRELALISCEDHCYSGEKARRELQMPVTPLELAVQESFQWLKSNGYVNSDQYAER